MPPIIIPAMPPGMPGEANVAMSIQPWAMGGLSAGRAAGCWASAEAPAMQMATVARTKAAGWVVGRMRRMFGSLDAELIACLVWHSRSKPAGRHGKGIPP
jgi:hypothetical protein